MQSSHAESREASRALKLGVVLFATCATLVSIEILIRLIVPQQAWRIQTNWEIWQTDPVLGWRMKPLSTIFTAEGWKVSTNEDGLRPENSKREKSKGVFRILLIGDSTVAAIGVRPEEGLHTKLGEILTAHGKKVEVLNAAVEGFSTDQSLLHLRDLLPLYKPDFVFYGFCTNDLEGNVSSEQYAMSKPYFEMKNGNLILHPPNPNKGVPDYRSPFARTLQRSALFGFFRPALASLRNRFRTGALQPASSTFEKADWKLLGREIAEMKAGAGFAFFSHPSISEVWNVQNENERTISSGEASDPHFVERKLANIAKEDRIEFVPMIDYFLTQRERGPFHLLPADPHSNAAGYLLIAETLARHIEPVRP